MYDLHTLIIWCTDLQWGLFSLYISYLPMMCPPTHPRSPQLYETLRRCVVLPMLGAVLLYQYSAWVGLPALVLGIMGRPPAYPTPSELMHVPPVLAAWLGLQSVGPLVPWVLFGAMVACVMQVGLAGIRGGSGEDTLTQAQTPKTTFRF